MGKTSDPYGEEKNGSGDESEVFDDWADKVEEGSTMRAILVLTASLSLVLERPSIDREAFLEHLESFVRKSIREFRTNPAETQWLLHFIERLRG